MHELSDQEQIGSSLREYVRRGGAHAADRRERLRRLLVPTERMVQWTRGRPEGGPWHRQIAAIRTELTAP